MDLDADLLEHCLGKQEPSSSLLKTGAFPNGWVELYLGLLDQAEKKWGTETAAPRKAVAAIHFASMYLSIRYQAWKGFNRRNNPITDAALCQVRTSSELWLLGCIRDRSQL